MASSNNMIIYSLPEKVRESRKNKGMTQTDLGLAMGTNKAAVSRLENGVKIPDLVTLKNAADAMEVSLSEWFADEALAPDPFFIKVQERTKGLAPEQRAQCEVMMDAALKMLGV